MTTTGKFERSGRKFELHFNRCLNFVIGPAGGGKLPPTDGVHRGFIEPAESTAANHFNRFCAPPLVDQRPHDHISLLSRPYRSGGIDWLHIVDDRMLCLPP